MTMNRLSAWAIIAIVVAVASVISVIFDHPPSLVNQVNIPTPKLHPGEWRDIKLLQGSQSSLRQRSYVSEQLQRRQTLQRSGAANWQFIGPENIGGRVTDLVVDTDTPNRVYAAAASGGVWRSDDAGDTFTSVWPDSNAQSIGALAMTNTGQLYAGTGESNPGGGSLTYGNAGVFSSNDGGATWAALGLENTERISRIAIDPNDNTRIFVAATGPLYAAGGERGVYRSIDGGSTWTASLVGDNDTTGASDVHIDPSNPMRVYAAMWDHLRSPALRRYGGEGSGIYRSIDGGDSWQRLGATHGLPDVDTDVGRVSITVAPSEPNTLFAMYLTTRGFFNAFYRSDNGGDTWTELAAGVALADSQASFGWWFARIWVDPSDAEHVFVAGVSLVESTDGGTSFSVIPGVHADQHAMAWDQNVINRVYLGNDGGVYRSEANGSSGWVFATKQPFTQFYTLDVSESQSNRVVGGTQDNRCVRSYNSVGQQWNQYANCGDGLETLINPLNQQIVYGCSQYGFCSYSLDGGESSSSIGPVASSRRNWLTPLVFDPTNPQIMYYAGNIIERSIDGGLNWQSISADLTGGDPFPSPIDPYPFGTTTSLTVAGSNPNKITIGTDGGRVWRTSDLGANWSQVSDPSLPNRWVSKVLADNDDENHLYLAYSGFRNSDNTPYVFETNDFGATWQDITSDLPSAPVNTLALDTFDRLLVGNDVGVYARQADGRWLDLGQGLPTVPVTDLRVHEQSQSVFASTFGRGIWQVSLLTDSDDDGINDAQDNCLLVANAQQIDTDNDNYGNACDADFDQSCAVNFLDLTLLSNNFLSTEALFDLNEDGVVNFIDVSLFSQRFLLAPGPSGTGNFCNVL